MQLSDRTNPDNSSTCWLIYDLTFTVRMGNIRERYYFRIDSKSSVMSFIYVYESEIPWL